jgi:hypothetical protein
LNIKSPEEFYLLALKPYIPLKIETFRRNMSSSKKPTALLAPCLFGLLFSNDDGGDVTPKRRFIFNGLYGGIFQKTEFFITAAVRTYYSISHLQIL